MKMGGDFDSPKSLYQSHYYEILDKLLELNKKNKTETNVLRKYQGTYSN